MAKSTARAAGIRRSARAGLAFLLALALGGPSAPAAKGSLAGRLLIASPELSDSNFARTVIYMIWHDGRGAFGLVVNQPMGEVPVAALLGDATASTAAETNEAAAEPVLVHYGGPVEPREPFALHSAEALFAGSVELDHELAMSPGAGALQAMTAKAAPERLLLVLGYAGWAPGQIEHEIAGGGWFVGPWDESLVFSEDPADSWNQAIARYGPEL